MLEAIRLNRAKLKYSRKIVRTIVLGGGHEFAQIKFF